MRIACLRAGVAGFLAFASGAQTPVGPFGQDPVTGETIAARPAPRSGEEFAVQDRDYSARALFMEAHGSFLNARDRYRPMLEASYLMHRTAEVKGEPGHFDLDHVRVDGRVRWPVDPDSFLIVGPKFSARHYNFNPQVVGAEDDTLYVAGANLGFGTFLEENLLLELVFSPGLYSDLDGAIKSRDWQWYGDALLTIRQTDQLYWKIGAYHSDDFRDVNLLPLAGVSWQFLPSMRLDVLLPKRAELSINPWTSTVLHLGVDLEGEQYRWRSEPATGKVRRNLWVQEIRARVGIVQRLTDNFSLFGNVGINLAGDYRFYDAAGNRYNGTLDPDFFFMVGMGIDF
jgi:hypothetical protein